MMAAVGALHLPPLFQFLPSQPLPPFITKGGTTTVGGGEGGVTEGVTGGVIGVTGGVTGGAIGVIGGVAGVTGITSGIDGI